MFRNPGYTAAAVMTLALGIAATTAIFSVVYGTFFAPLPYRDFAPLPDRDPDALVMAGGARGRLDGDGAQGRGALPRSTPSLRCDTTENGHYRPTCGHVLALTR